MARRPKSPKATRASRLDVSTIVYAVVALLALLGIADALYLTVLDLTGQAALCGGSASCSQVLSSKYSHVGPIPVASLGLIGYFNVFSLALLAAFGRLWAHRWLAGTVALMFLATLGFLYLQAFVLRSFCPYCLFSAAMTFLLAGIVLATKPAKASLVDP